MVLSENEVFGFVKPIVDVHTLGISIISNLLKDCGYKAIVAPNDIAAAVIEIKKLNNFSLIKKWIQDNNITRLGFSYRLDPNDGCEYFMMLLNHLKDDNVFDKDGGCLKSVFFAGLPDACELVSGKTNNSVLCFEGGEPPMKSLTLLGVLIERIPKSLTENDEYDSMRWDFAKKLIDSESFKTVMPQDHYGYATCGKDNDNFVDRLEYARSKQALPLIRVHMGPYNPNRIEALKEFNSWVKEMADSRLLDILSIGSSQLTQSHFGENWDGFPNGGGVPVNSALEYAAIRETAKPMLARTYSGTKNVPHLAEIHEQSLNISWHALSFWWFCELDGRGENDLLANLKEHFETVKYIVSTNKPVEPNVPHHFAFRGADDVTYIISGYLAAKAAKKLGIKNLILQNMLNTPKYTSGRQDLAKGRAMLRLVKELEDNSFKVHLQSRAGLDYFDPDLEKAQLQLAAVTALMDDIEPENIDSPEIVHVVSYSEAVRLATPPVIKDSIKITLDALNKYRLQRNLGTIPNMAYDTDVKYRTEELYEEAKDAILLLESHIPNLYTPEGFYQVFKQGFFPVPYLIDEKNKYPEARNYTTALKDGGIRVVDDKGQIVDTRNRYRDIISKNS